jgi:hypothetical protein
LALTLSACASASENDTTTPPSAGPTTADAGPPPALTVRSAAGRISHVGYGSSTNPRVMIRAVLATSADVCGPVPATRDDMTVSLEILTAEDALRPQVLAHAPEGVSPGTFRGWVHRVADDCRVEAGAGAVAFDEGATLGIVDVDGGAVTLRVHFASRAGTFDGTVTTRTCVSDHMHLDPFADDAALPGCVAN